MLDDAEHKSHAVDCDVANIVRILLTLKILSRKFLKIIFMLMPSLPCKMIFPFCLIVSMIKTCFL